MLKALQIKLFSFFCAPFLSLFMRIHNLCLKQLSCLVPGMQQVGLNITQTSSRFSLGPKCLILLFCPWPQTIPVFLGPALRLIPVPLSGSGQLELLCGSPHILASTEMPIKGGFSRWLSWLVVPMPYFVVKHSKCYSWYTHICLPWLKSLLTQNFHIPIFDCFTYIYQIQDYFGVPRPRQTSIFNYWGLLAPAISGTPFFFSSLFSTASSEPRTSANLVATYRMNTVLLSAF